MKSLVQRPEGSQLARQNRDELDAAVMPPEQVIDEVANDQVWFAAASVDDPARQYPGCAIPLNIDRPAPTQSPAPELGPAWRAPGLSLEQYLEPMRIKSPVIRDRVTKTGARCADHLNQCLQTASGMPRNV